MYKVQSVWREFLIHAEIIAPWKDEGVFVTIELAYEYILKLDKLDGKEYRVVKNE